MSDQELVCIVDGARGIYVPREFAQRYSRNPYGPTTGETSP